MFFYHHGTAQCYNSHAVGMARVLMHVSLHCSKHWTILWSEEVMVDLRSRFAILCVWSRVGCEVCAVGRRGEFMSYAWGGYAWGGSVPHTA